MKTYIKAIENILQAELSEPEIEKYEFTDNVLQALADYSQNYSGEIKKTEFKDELVCFMSFQEIISCEFNTYPGSGELGMHWPDDNTLANTLLFNDRVLLHDHLTSYASSGITGYTVGYRYHGIRNWLMKLAKWKHFILDGQICVIPKDLAYSPEVKKIWDNGLTSLAMELISETDKGMADLIAIGYFDECLDVINDICYMIADLSIPGNFTKPAFPALLNNESSIKYKKIIDAFIRTSTQEYRGGSEPGQDNKMNEYFTTSINFPSPLNKALLNHLDIIGQQKQSNEIRAIRNNILALLKEISGQQQFSRSYISELKSYINGKEREWSRLYSQSNKNNLRISPVIAAAFLPGIKRSYTEENHQVFQIVFDLLNNTPIKTNNELLLNYSFSAINE